MTEGAAFEGGSTGEGTPGHTLAAGARVQEFEIVGLVGEGGFGVVYEARDLALHRRVALKEYLPGRLAERDASGQVRVRSPDQAQAFEAGLRSFVNESRMLARFRHPALVEVLRYWEQNGTAYMAMPYYEGQTLKQVLASRPHEVDEAWLRSIVRPLIGAMNVMHSADCHHLDIAPDNILILPDGRPLLLDLGSARRAATDAVQALTVMLKPGYTPLEQYADDPAMRQGPWSDIYALGAVLYFAIVGKPPPPAVSRLVTDPLVPLAQQAHPGYSLRFLQAIDAALAVRPENRPQSLADLCRLLDIEAPGQPELAGASGNVQAALFESAAPAPSPLASPPITQGPATPAPDIPAPTAPAPTPSAAARPQSPSAVDTGRAGAAVGALKDVMGASYAKQRAKGSPAEGAAQRAGETAQAAGAGTPREATIPRLAELGAARREPGAIGAAAASAGSRASRDDPQQPVGASASVTSASPRSASNTTALAVVAVVALLLLGVGGWLLFWPAEEPPDARVSAGKPAVIGRPASDSPGSGAAAPAPAAAAGATTAPGTTGAPDPAKPDEQSLVSALSGTPTQPAGTAGTATPAAPAKLEQASGASAQPTLPATAPTTAGTATAPATASSAPSPAERMATVQIVVRPWGEVVVNGESRGPSPPLKRLTLKPGKYEIQLKNPAGPAAVRKLELRPGQSVTLKHQF